MAGPRSFDMVQESSTTVGTISYVLLGATTGHQSFGAKLSNGDTAYYMVTDGVNWEVGLGTYTTVGTSLARTTILDSSNSGSAVSWSVGTRTVNLVSPALFFNLLLNSGAALSPAASGGLALGTSSFPWSNLFLASGDKIDFANGDTTLVHSTGALALNKLFDLSGSSAGQIQFPSAQNASSNVNTLDDYKEGTWTPSVGGTATYNAANAARYRKIGSCVFIDGILSVNAIGTGSNNLMQGLPYTVAAAPTGGISVVNFSSIIASTTHLTFRLQASTTTMQLQGASGVSTGDGGWAAIQSGTIIAFSGWYSV